METGRPIRLRNKPSIRQNAARKNKKTVRMISLKVSVLRESSSFSKGRVALEPQAGHEGWSLFLGKQYPRSQRLVEFGKKLLAVAVFELLAENGHA